ncbi:hypothetical protein [Alteromonas oceanisediminis]|uniref:hypothetical protein n=1 Tax=Alteromonas oceanisediminis TaxID=2836180 RepID=UPI001BD9E775|nr:hypothetical protein [Alteromonas oceanisediminis]MBT0585501.1 hypothetical protein [Alteromonas oceanisediminis]
MLLLSILISLVCLLFVYALMRDTGKNTPYARRNSVTQISKKSKVAALDVQEGDTEVAA